MRTGIALGSNLGNRSLHLQSAFDFLAQFHQAPSPPLVSLVYETLPVNCPPGSPSFLNAVMEIQTSLSPHELLDRCASLEQSLGRPARRMKNSPRPLDLDILYYGDLILESDSLTIPHPLLVTRDFVLRPLADIRPNLILPKFSKSIAQLLADLAPNEISPQACRIRSFTQNSSTP